MAVSNRVSPVREAARLAASIVRDFGRELRVARISGGMTQRATGERIGKSASYVSRVENGRIAGVKMTDLVRHAAALGLRPWFRLYPSGRRPLDAPQLATLHRLRERLSHAWVVAIEVPVPIAGDLRAADAVISIPGCRCLVEVITRLADWQAQVRAARLKHRDLGTDRLLLVIADTTTNRRLLRSVPDVALTEFPLRTREALAALRAGLDPGGDAVVLI